MSLDGGATFAHVPPTLSAFDASHTHTCLGVLRGSVNQPRITAMRRTPRCTGAIAASAPCSLVSRRRSS